MKLRKNVKKCWIIKQYRKGWRIGLAVSRKTFWLPVWFKDVYDAERAIGSKTVEVYLKEND